MCLRPGHPRSRRELILFNSVFHSNKWRRKNTILLRHVQTTIPITLDECLLVLEADMADHSVQEVWSPRENNLLINTPGREVTKLVVFKMLMGRKHDQRKSHGSTCGPKPQGVHEEFSLGKEFQCFFSVR